MHLPPDLQEDINNALATGGAGAVFGNVRDNPSRFEAALRGHSPHPGNPPPPEDGSSLDLSYIQYGVVGYPTFSGGYEYQTVPNSVLEELGIITRDRGGGGAGRTQFPSEARLDESQALLAETQAGLLPETTRADIIDQQTQRYLDALELQLNRELGLGGLDVQRERNAIDRLLGLEGLEIERGRLGVDTRTLEESIRANRAREREDARRRMLEAATNAVAAYQRATELADARRLAALQETRALLPQVLPEGMPFLPGFGPNDPLAAAMGSAGLPFSPFPANTIRLNPSQLALPPSADEIGQGSMDFINQIIQTGGIQ